jgi:integrase/recombinase XerD
LPPSSVTDPPAKGEGGPHEPLDSYLEWGFLPVMWRLVLGRRGVLSAFGVRRRPLVSSTSEVEMGKELEGRAGARSDEPEARSAARWRVPSSETVADGTGGVVGRWPALAECEDAIGWLSMLADLGRSARTVDAYGRALADFFGFCDRVGLDALSVGRGEVARYVRDLRERPGRLGENVVAIDSGAGLSNATLRLRLTALRLFFDFLVEEGRRERNPVGRGRSGFGRGRSERGLVPVFSRLPWIPTDEQWRRLLEVAAGEPLRNRLMVALAYDAGLRREELCLLRTDDLDPAHRTLRVRAETTKTRRGRVVPYSATAGVLLQGYLARRRTITRERGGLLVSESRRNLGAPIGPWTWSKVVRALALRAGLPGFSTHTLRHLCLTDLARSGWELHQIAAFAGHRSTQTTLQYIHLSGRELAAKLAGGMAEIHSERVAQISEAFS